MRLVVKVAGIFGILLITVLVMAPALKGGFFFDDTPNIVDNTAIHITQLSIDSLRQSLNGAQAGPLGRPVSVLSFALTYYFFGLDAVAFKAVNLAIHLINGLLIYWFILLLFRNARVAILPAHSAQGMALCAAAFWLVHPINIMPVMLAVQRMTLFSCMFMLLALICHIKGMLIESKRKFLYLWLGIGWLVCWPLAVLSKENGILFPFYALMIMLLIKTISQRYINKQAWWVVIGASILLMLSAVWLLIFRWNWIEAGYAMRSFSIEERLMTQARVLWFYFGQIALPNYFSFGVYLDDFVLSRHLLQPFTTLIAIMCWIISIVAVIKYWRRYPLPCFGVGWFLVGHLLESTFLPLEIAHEYRNYMPSIGVVVGVGWLGFTGIQKAKFSNKSILFMTIPILVILLLSFITWLRASQLGDPIMGPQLEAQRHPQSASANYEAAAALFRAGRGHATEDPFLGQTIKTYFEQAGAIDPAFRLGYIGLIVWACASNIAVESRWVDELSSRLKNVPFGPADINLPNTIGDPILAMPSCLNRQQTERLFEAGASNTTATYATRAQFLERLAYYELAVSKDIKSAQFYLAKAVKFSPTDSGLQDKLNNLNKMHD